VTQGAGFAQTTTGGVVQGLSSESDDALLDGLRRGDPVARRELFERYSSHVERVLVRVLGRDQELADALHDTFVQAFVSVSSVREASALKAWMSIVAVYTARGIIRRRKARRWLRFWAPEELPEPPSTGPNAEEAWAVSRVYQVLDKMPADQRIAFSLRYIEGMSLHEVAEAAGCSLATIKRRLTRAQAAFLEASRKDPLLAAWAERCDQNREAQGDESARRDEPDPSSATT
jgi:RNA polymerase sigma-70 factor (ECF subfamily)